jgi:hypothetical protein
VLATRAGSADTTLQATFRNVSRQQDTTEAQGTVTTAYDDVSSNFKTPDETKVLTLYYTVYMVIQVLQ